nr:response regulator [uncultured Undibacterium sp.]
MESLAHLISAFAALAWPLVCAVLVYIFYEPIKSLIESARGRKFTFKVAGNELTMEEASEQQRFILSDLQTKIAELEKRFEDKISKQQSPNSEAAGMFTNITPKIESQNLRILWVDDNPKNNSYLVANLEAQGALVEISRSTEDAMSKFRNAQFDAVISDMGRPESKRAGLDLNAKIKESNPEIPVFIFCGNATALRMHDEAIRAGVREITASPTTLLSALHKSTR